MSVGKNIRALRKMAGLTQEELAHASELSIMSIRRYESDVRLPPKEAMNRIAMALQVPVSQFEDELSFLMAFAKESCFDQDINRELLRMLWTAYCLHKGLDTNSTLYLSTLLNVWDVVRESEEDTADWKDARSFDGFMRQYLV